MVTWAIFERATDRRRFRLLDTHLPYRAEDEAARVRCARMIVDRLATLPGADLPTVLTGDFNTAPDSEAYRVLTGRLADTRTAARKRRGPEQTFHAFTGTPDRRIDWILATGFTPRAARTLTDHTGSVWASDHFPIAAELAFTR
jgi:endonuclease/exonuclease/phosphatase family metal-dependent hydrolase